MEPMQAKFAEGDRDDVSDRGGCAAVVRLAHPEADTCGLERTAGDPVDSDTPDDLPVSCSVAARAAASSTDAILVTVVTPPPSPLPCRLVPQDARMMISAAP